jgi:hypothetical protein
MWSGVIAPIILTLALVGCKWRIPRLGRITPRVKVPRFQPNRRLGGPRSSFGEDRILYLSYEWKLNKQFDQTVA